MSPAERDMRDQLDVLTVQVGALNDERVHLRDRVAQLEVALIASLKGTQEATAHALRLIAAPPPRPRG